MVIQLKLWSKHKVQVVVQFLYPRNLSPAETDRPVKVNKNDVMCQQNTEDGVLTSELNESVWATVKEVAVAPQPAHQIRQMSKQFAKA
jgi:hypothetical protein